MLAILVLEDEAPVRDAILRDLKEFATLIRIEAAEDVPDAWEATKEIEADKDTVALILADHRLPGQNGVDFLVELQTDERLAPAKTVLVTGQADQDDTIRALNDAGLDYYISKPWEPQDLQAVVREYLTDFVLDNKIDPLPYLRVLNQARAMTSWRDSGL